MIKGRDILIFCDDWGRHPSTLIHIAKELLPYNRIFWVGSLGLRKPKFNPKDLKRAFVKLVSIFFPKSKTIHSEPSPILINPFIIPWHDLQIIRNWNFNSIQKSVNAAFDKYAVKNPILITSSPIVHQVLDDIKFTSSHYICVDDYTEFEGAFKCIGQLENLLLQKVDSCFAVSNNLLNTRKIKNGNNFYLSQGVNTKHYQNINSDLSCEKLGIAKPVIGFFGLISEWINVELIVKVAKVYPKCSIILIGKSTVDTALFSSCPNIKYIGYVNYNELPKYAALFDVGLIPFRVNPLTIASNPLKLLEYFALGIPVVSTNLPEMEKFSQACFISADEEQFVRMVSEALNENLANKKLRLEIAEQHSWKSVAINLSNKILEIEKEKGNGN